MNKLKFDPVRLRFLEKTYPITVFHPVLRQSIKAKVLIWKTEDGEILTEVRHD